LGGSGAARVVTALAAVVVVLVLWAVLPRERVPLVAFDGGLPDDLDAYLADAEAQVPGLREGVEKRILWAGARGAATPLSLVYLHGYSATNREIFPVVEEVAAALGANLFLSRMTGHGLPGEALARATPGDWVRDAGEAVAIGRRLGGRVVVVATSTGAPWAVLGAQAGAPADAYVFLSPNFGLRNPAARLLTLPLARHWVGLVAGAWRTWQPINEEQARYWTTRYPTVALVPMAAAVAAARASDVGAMRAPLLVLYRDEDQVVDARQTRRLIARWGGPVREVHPEMMPGDDPEAHVIAGAIMSPGATPQVVEALIAWIRAPG
jgi:alpha-beta hydrolase superfamily lysophospholipase